MLRGACLCGAVRYEIEGKVSGIGMCHCSVCRKASGAVSNAALVTAARSFRWVSGEDQLKSYSRPSGYTTTFCTSCGSPMPRRHENGKVVMLPAGSLDDDPGTGVAQHIFVGSKAGWDEIAGDAPQYEEWAPEDS